MKISLYGPGSGMGVRGIAGWYRSSGGRAATSLLVLAKGQGGPRTGRVIGSFPSTGASPLVGGPRRRGPGRWSRPRAEKGSSHALCSLSPGRSD